MSQNQHFYPWRLPRVETLRVPGANAKVAGLPWVMYLLKAMKMPWCLSALCTEHTNGTCDKNTTYLALRFSGLLCPGLCALVDCIVAWCGWVFYFPSFVRWRAVYQLFGHYYCNTKIYDTRKRLIVDRRLRTQRQHFSFSSFSDSPTPSPRSFRWTRATRTRIELCPWARRRTPPHPPPPARGILGTYLTNKKRKPCFVL